MFVNKLISILVFVLIDRDQDTVQEILNILIIERLNFINERITKR